jgi:hypothetical protein
MARLSRWCVADDYQLGHVSTTLHRQNDPPQLIGALRCWPTTVGARIDLCRRHRNGRTPDQLRRRDHGAAKLLVRAAGGVPEDVPADAWVERYGEFTLRLSDRRFAGYQSRDLMLCGRPVDATTAEPCLNWYQWLNHAWQATLSNPLVECVIIPMNQRRTSSGLAAFYLFALHPATGAISPVDVSFLR